MAFNPVTGIKDMSAAMKSFSKELNDVLKTLKTIAPIAQSVTGDFKKINAVGNIGVGNKMGLGVDGANVPVAASSGNRMATSLATSRTQQVNAARFSGMMPTMIPKTRIAGGIAQIALAPMAGVYSALPDLGTVTAMASGFYGAAAGTGVNYQGLQRATFSALTAGTKAGVTSATDMAAAGAMLSQGYNMYAGGQSYMQTMREVGGAARFLNMNNATAAQALGQYQTGAYGAKLYQYGIAQFDKNMRPRSQAAIAQDLYNRMFRGQRMTAEQMSEQLQYGTAGPTLREIAGSEENYAILQKQFLLMAQGKSPDLTKQKGVGNPNLPAQQIATSEAGLAVTAQDAMTKGFQTAADAVTKFNKAMEGTPEAILKLKGAIQGFSGSNAGKGLTSTAVGVTAGVKNILLGIGGYKLLKAMGLRGATTAATTATTASASAAGAGGAAAAETAMAATAAEAATAAAGGTAAAAALPVTAAVLTAAALTKIGVDYSRKKEYERTHYKSGVRKYTAEDYFNQARGGTTVGFGSSFNGPGGNAGGNAVTSPGTVPFGARDSIWSGGAHPYHTGEDIQMNEGTPVYSVGLPGIVIDEMLGQDLGTYVQIDHQNGYQTIYGHLSSKSVRVGDAVPGNSRIGTSGSTGKCDGPVLHFEVRKGKNNPVPPSELTGAGGYNPTSGATAQTVSGKQTLAHGTILGTGSQQAWAKDFLSRLGKPTTPDNIKAITTWMAWEGGHWKNSAHYNPLNTTLNAQGASSMNKVGVKSYLDYEQGMKATIDTINAGKYGYPKILDALSSGHDTQGVINAVNSSKWGTHIKGGTAVGFGSNGAQAPIVAGGNTVNVTLTINQASEEEAIRFAKKVKSMLENDSSVALIGSN